MDWIGNVPEEIMLPEEETSSTTQPYVEDESEQLNDSGCSTPAGKANAANANPVQSRGISPACQTPSPYPPNRANFQISSVAVNSREQCTTPSTSKFQLNVGASSRDLRATSFSNFPINAAANLNGQCSPKSPQVHGISIPAEGTETKLACNGTEHTRKRPVSRALFTAPSPEKARKLISNDVKENLLQLDGRARESRTSDCRTEVHLISCRSAGVIVGLRYYQYWTHKDTGKDFEKKKKPVDEQFYSSIHCFFVCTSSEAEADINNEDFRQFRTRSEARCYMMHIHTSPNIAKYISRLQLALSQTQPIDLDFATITVKFEPDIHCKDKKTGLETICTDGTGYISVDLAKEIAISLDNGMPNPEKAFGTQDYPSPVQIRLFYKGSASKGTLLAHNGLGRRTIVLRPSMQKVKSDPELSECQSYNSLEICGYSSKPPREAKLSRDLIVLLTLRGVPRSFFMELVDKAIEKLTNMMSDPKAAWNVIQDWNSEQAKLAQRMLLVGMHPKEPFLQKSLMELRKDLLQDFRKGRVSLPDSCYLYGRADPTGTLEPNQVAISMDYGLVSLPQVAVYKHPGKHPGDIHIFEAIAKKEIQDIVGTGKYVIFFSTKGSRSIPDEIASSDLDGDQYLITWNTKLLSQFKELRTRWLKTPEEGGEPSMCKPVDLPWEKLEDILIEKFINARFNSSKDKDIGTVANSWLTHMDRSLFLRDLDFDQSDFHYKQALNIIKYFYALVDSEKTGIKVNFQTYLRPRESPHFLEKGTTSKDGLRPRESRHFLEKGTTSNDGYMKDKNCGYGIYVDQDKEQNIYQQKIIYQSTTILGEIYDKAHRAEENWRLQSYEYIELEKAFKVTENNVYFSKLCTEWLPTYEAYKEEMATHMSRTESNLSLREAGCSAIYLKYRRHLYDADSLDESRREPDVLFAHASAIYAVVYQDARRRSCGSGGWARGFDFAWKVAGALLFRMFEKYYRPDGEDQLIVSMQALKSFFGKSYSQDNTEDTASPFEED